MSLKSTSKSIMGSTLLITGCCIGAGMIGLPMKSALAGFLPSTVAMVLCYIFTTITGLFLVEATLWFDEKVNLPTIVESTLGKKSKYIALILFLALFYSLFVAYLDGSGMIFSDILTSITGISVSKKIGIIICTVFVAIITYTGTHLASRFNQLLLLGLIISYVLLIVMGLSHVSIPSTSHTSFISMLNVIPIMLICFGYQNLVPSITYYLKKNVNHIRIAIILGNLIPLGVYILWNYVILSIMPHDLSLVKNAEIVTQLLQHTIAIFSIVILIKSFSLFAMLTSFIPSALSLVDFIKDGVRHSIKIHNDLFYLGLIFIPSFIFSISYPHIFLNMLDFAGGFVDVLLFGIVPAMVILRGRKIMGKQEYQVIGGNFTPVMIIISSCIILIIKAKIFS